MLQAAFERFWELLGGVFALNADAFRSISDLPLGLIVAIAIVVAAGLSQAMAQSIILFINQVKPIRFIFSLLLNAVLFTFGYLFLVLSTWVVTLLPWTQPIPLIVLIVVLGISYAPLVFSFLGAIPYLGVPLLTVLAIWHLWEMVIGITAVTELGMVGAVSYVAVGWLVLRLLESTVGQPLANLGRWLSNKIAGVPLVTSNSGLRRILQGVVEQSAGGVQISPQSSMAGYQVPSFDRTLTDRQAAERSNRRRSRSSPSDSTEASNEEPIVFTLDPASIREAVLKLRTTRKPPQGVDRKIRTILGLVGMAVLVFLVVVAFDPLRTWIFAQIEQLPQPVRFLFDLAWIGLIALVVAGLLAPLESLGWWAGWYADDIDTILNAGTLATPITDESEISRYVVYLDGISKSTFEYLPDVEEFLHALTPALPENVALIRDIMPYSVLNNPLIEDRPLAFLWRLTDDRRLNNPASLLGMLINLRNVWTVAVSADKRYGPIYNQGIAQVIYNGLINHGYHPDTGIPVTLIGFSGGGQMAAACAPFLRRALSGPIDVISLGGVISGNCNILKLEHLYHLVGQKDIVERLGAVMFPGRWKLFPLSYWNRAKQRGKISFVSLGPVGHQIPGGLMDPDKHLPDGRSYLQQTIDLIAAILHGELLREERVASRKPSNYQLYQQADFNHPDYYPLSQSVPLDRYQPIAPWMGRLILPTPSARRRVKGALFEVHHAPAAYQHLIGRIVMLQWSYNPNVRALVRAVTKDVHFSAEADYTSEYGGLVHPERLDHWRQVGPLESLAGSRPQDDVIVMLPSKVTVEDYQRPGGGGTQETPIDAAHSSPHSASRAVAYVLRIERQPVQITGRFYGLVQFQAALEGDRFQVVHFNRQSRQFDGPAETVRLPQVVADQNGVFPSTSRGIEHSALNETGWYIYGAADADGVFVVQSIAPRSLLWLQPDRVVFGTQAAYHYIRKQAWANIAAQKGKVSSVLLSPREHDLQAAIDDWQVGDRALVLHVYGGIGGKKREPAAATPLFFGHFAYGVATVVHDPIADERRFDIRYYQVYTHNTDGLVAGVLHWSRYMGDRQFGWMGTRPVADILIKLEAFTGRYQFGDVARSPLENMLQQLEAMTARYRIGDGTGGTYVGAANNCAQDSNQALFASLVTLETNVRNGQEWLEQWVANYPDQAQRFEQLLQLKRSLKRQLQPFGVPRPDWEKNEYNLGSTLEDEPLRNLVTGLGSWRTILPRLASDAVVKSFLREGATVWVLRTNQVGGFDPDIEPIAPMTL
jgi:predicted Abi (CAAX) family protease